MTDGKFRMASDDLDLLEIQFTLAPEHRQMLSAIEKQKEEIDKCGWTFNSEEVPERVRKSFIYAYEEVRQQRSLSAAKICALHQCLDKNFTGKYRVRKPYESICIWNDTDNPYFPPDPEYIPSLMEQYVKRYETQNTMHPLEQACAAYLLFEIIHPFDDGNGRVGRLIAAWLMLQQGYGFLASSLESLWGSENKQHSETFRSDINNYRAWMHDPRIWNDFFQRFYFNCLKDFRFYPNKP